LYVRETGMLGILRTDIHYMFLIVPSGLVDKVFDAAQPP
jgi:hypothetical protein